MPSPRFRHAWLGFLLVIPMFALPILTGLDGTDMRSDEAIYSYAVERVLDTGEWLTPRSIPSDAPFLEKPPLKFWLVAAAIKSGVLPRNEVGLRFLDALFGAIAFGYIYWFGCRLAGPACGIVAVLVLYTMDPLLFEHGLRSDNMEASVFLAYCGGLYHFARWAESEPAAERSRRLHALAVAGFFVLGFMTKFVAALFLPVVCVVAFALRPDARTRLRIAWRDWVAPVMLAAAFIVPWFVYESVQFGREFWQIIFGQHVFTRFTTSLDPSHVHAWHHYFSATWKELSSAGAQVLTIAGIAQLSMAAWRGRPWMARLTWLWAMLPMALISIGTSKLLHYAYPFWPPFGLAAGFAVATILQAIDLSANASGPSRDTILARRVVSALAIVLAALATWTLIAGQVRWEWGDLVILRNSSPIRPALFAVVLLVVAFYSTTRARMAGSMALAFLLPLGAYADKLQQLSRIDHPLRATRDCVAAVRASGVPTGPGIISASGNVLHHSYYYYLWRTGPWTIAPQFSLADTEARLVTPGAQTPVILQRSDYDLVTAALGKAASDIAVRYDDHIAVLLPGPFASCTASILQAGGGTIWPGPAGVLR